MIQIFHIFLLFIILPTILTVWNIYTFIKLIMKKEENHNRLIEIFGIFCGILFTYIFLGISEVVFADWDVTIFRGEYHTMISSSGFPTISILFIISIIGWGILKFIDLEKQPPLVTVLSMSSMYIGIFLLIMWCIQTFGVELGMIGSGFETIFLLLFPINCILVYIKAIFTTIHKKTLLLEKEKQIENLGYLSKILKKASALPWVSLIFTLPFLGVVIIFLLLFGQEPDSIIKAWTDTADWNLSTKIPEVYYIEGKGGHYLCTVAARGHKNIVKPTRVGIRHGNLIIVNRQLCIANAFEQVISEKFPRTHRVIRNLYDKYGYPLSRHIKTKFSADIVYILMKPLEWIFLIFLYLVDIKPENRIATQYFNKKI